jgi:hypothetical protein
MDDKDVTSPDRPDIRARTTDAGRLRSRPDADLPASRPTRVGSSVTVSRSAQDSTPLVGSSART